MAGTADAAPTPRRSSLSRRLVGLLLLLTLLVSAAVTAIQLASDYRRNSILLRELVTERVGSIVEVLGASIWNVDEAGVRMLLHGLNHDPGVARAELRTLDGERFSVGGPPELALATLRFDLTHAPAGGRTVGSLWVTLLDGTEVRERVFGRLQAIVLTTGEEFAAVLVDVNSDRLLQAAERVRTSIAADPIAIAGVTLVRCSASVGAVLTGTDAPHLDDLLRRADEALYLATRSGRNRVVVWSDGRDGVPGA
jgi:hypothetical protein